jgi:hypothetical protein
MRHSLFKLTFACLSFYAASSSIAEPSYPATKNFGVPYLRDEPWYQQCMRVEHRSAPNTPARRSVTSQCNASDLYYQKRSQAVTSVGEWNKVRECAIAQEDNAVLMMLYANGFGVRRDTDIATRYACSLDFVAKAEMEARIEHLTKAQSSNAVFDQCDDITSGYMGSICASIRESQAQRVRAARLDRLVHALPESTQVAFKRLRAAAAAYVGAASAEVDMHGTGAPGFAIEHDGKLREQFMQVALDVLSNKSMPDSPSGTVRLDEELNAVYQKLMTAPSTQEGWPNRIGESTIDRTEVRNAERRWLAYRDAFIAFGTTLSPGFKPDAIKALLTTQRIAELTAIAGYL